MFFVGGVILAVYTMSIWPEMIDRVTLCPPGQTLFIAMLTVVCEVLYSVWTVAYNFVPGGVYTREHTGWLIGFLMFSIALAMFFSMFYFNYLVLIISQINFNANDIIEELSIIGSICD